MAKTCLNKLSGNVAQSCTITPVGVKNIYLMYAADVTFKYEGAGVIMTTIFADGAKSYKIEGYKQNIQVTASLKTTDASARVDSSVTFKIPFGYSTRGLINSLASGMFRVLAEFNDGDYALLGDSSPLECSSVDFDSNANAKMATVTLASPEGSAGNNARSIGIDARNTIISKSV